MTDFPAHFGAELAKLADGIVALIGGGGKTSLMFALARHYSAAGRSVLCTTTTKLAMPSAESYPPFRFHPDPAAIRVGDGSALLAVRRPPPDGDPGKVSGYSPEEIDALRLRRAADWILVEADGSAGRPLKSPDGHEPALPSLAGCVVAVLGLGGIGKPFGPDTVFRTGRAAALTGLGPGETVTPEAAALLAVHPLGMFHNTPANARRVIFCNQADLPGAPEAAKALAIALAAKRPRFLHAVYSGSVAKDGLTCLGLTAP